MSKRRSLPMAIAVSAIAVLTLAIVIATRPPLTRTYSLRFIDGLTGQPLEYVGVIGADTRYPSCPNLETFLQKMGLHLWKSSPLHESSYSNEFMIIKVPEGPQFETQLDCMARKYKSIQLTHRSGTWHMVTADPFDQRG